MIFSGDGFHWRRVVDDYNRLSLFDFGAIADGKTDSAPAIKAMYQWSQQSDQPICVQFPAGTFFVTGCDFGEEQRRFSVSPGPWSTSATSRRPPSFLMVNPRLCLRSAPAGGNLQPYFQWQYRYEAEQAGPVAQYLSGRAILPGACLRFNNVGGTALSLLDTLDCKIDQWYASACTGDVIQAGWSGQKKGNWDHSTAIELSNFNAQHCKGGKVLNLPRCSQSLIHNGWIEHCDNPGDISNGQWIIDALSLEDCKNPLIAWHSRLNTRQTNLQSGSWIDNSEQGDRWLSAWEMGSTRVESYGVAIDGSLKYNYLTSRWLLENNTSQPVWYELANLYSPTVGDSWEIEVFGQSQFNNGTDSEPLMNLIDGRNTGGRAVIHVQRKKDHAEASWSAEGSSPVLDVRYVAKTDTDTQVFIRLAGWTPSAAIMIKSTAKDRFRPAAARGSMPKWLKPRPTVAAMLHRSALVCTTAKRASAQMSKAISCWLPARCRLTTWIPVNQKVSCRWSLTVKPLPCPILPLKRN